LSFCDTILILILPVEALAYIFFGMIAYVIWNIS
jgi:hypothetical protein